MSRDHGPEVLDDLLRGHVEFLVLVLGEQTSLEHQDVADGKGRRILRPGTPATLEEAAATLEEAAASCGSLTPVTGADHGDVSRASGTVAVGVGVVLLVVVLAAAGSCFLAAEGDLISVRRAAGRPAADG